MRRSWSRLRQALALPVSGFRIRWVCLPSKAGNSTSSPGRCSSLTVAVAPCSGMASRPFSGLRASARLFGASARLFGACARPSGPADPSGNASKLFKRQVFALEAAEPSSESALQEGSGARKASTALDHDLAGASNAQRTFRDAHLHVSSVLFYSEDKKIETCWRGILGRARVGRAGFGAV